MLHPNDIDAVVFDMGGVFIIPAAEPLGELLAEAGVRIEIDSDGVHEAHYRGIRAISEFVADLDIAESDPRMWEHYDRAYFSALGLTGEQALAAATARTASRATNAGTRRVDAQGRGQVQRMWSHVLSDNIAGFRRIAESRPVAIVSNNDGTAAKQCRDASICQVGPGPFVEVVALVDSGELGIAKPDPRIFTPAIDALDVDPARTLYVGDTVHADVRGATAAGLPVVQLDPYGLHAEDPHWTLPDVSALADHLEGLGVPPRS